MEEGCSRGETVSFPSDGTALEKKKTKEQRGRWPSGGTRSAGPFGFATHELRGLRWLPYLWALDSSVLILR